MNKNIMNIPKVDTLYKEIDEYIFKLQSDISKISELVEVLSGTFMDENQNKIYSEILDRDIVDILNDIEKMKNLNRVMLKMKDAYSSMENEFSSKNIIEGGLN